MGYSGRIALAETGRVMDYNVAEEVSLREHPGCVHISGDVEAPRLCMICHAQLPRLNNTAIKTHHLELVSSSELVFCRTRMPSKIIRPDSSRDSLRARTVRHALPQTIFRISRSVKVAFAVPRTVFGLLGPIFLAAQIRLASVDPSGFRLRRPIWPTRKDPPGRGDECLLGAFSGVVGDRGILASVGVFVKGVVHGSVGVQVGAFLEAFVFTFPAVLFRLDMGVS
jgi:hypothetical protein